MKKINLLKIRIDCLEKQELVQSLSDAFNNNHKIKIGKINTEFLLRAITSSEFAETINSFDLNITDGSGVLWAAKYMSLPLIETPVLRQLQAIWQMLYSGLSLIFKPDYCYDVIPERFPGVEALFLMLKLAEKSHQPVYFLGAEKKVSVALPSKLKEKFPEIIIAGCHEGYQFEDVKVINEINRQKAKLLVVALGSPKQEYWIKDNIDMLDTVKIAVGEGGSFDFIVGENKRAPVWMRKIGLEWLWRLFMNANKTGDPQSRSKRRLKRVWQAVPVFIFSVVKYKLQENKR